MRRSAGVLVLLSVLVGCQDDVSAPGRGPGPLSSAQEAEAPFSQNARFYVLGRTWTSGGALLTYLAAPEDRPGDAVVWAAAGLYSGTTVDGATTWTPYPGADNQVTFAAGFNDDVWPVVEVCRLDGDVCGAYRASFVRQPGQIEVPGGSQKYRLALNNGQSAWWAARPAGAYRVLIGVAPMDFDAASPKVLGSFDHDGNGALMAQFRIEDGALCSNPEDPGACFESSITPGDPTTIILDDELLPGDVEGVVGLQFPSGWLNGGTVGQVKVNLIIERIFRNEDGNIYCLPAELTGGEVQYDPCYSVRTEPYLGDNAFAGNPVTFGVCLQAEATAVAETGLLTMKKYSGIKGFFLEQIATSFLSGGDEFFACPPDYSSTGLGSLAPPPASSRFALGLHRLTDPVLRLLLPAPLQARVAGGSPFGGKLSDFSTLGLVGPEDSYTAWFLGPVGSETASSMVAPLGRVVTVRACGTGSNEGRGCRSIAAPGWSSTDFHYQVNWDTSGLPEGTWRIDALVDGHVASGGQNVFARTRPGTVSGDPYVFQIGRTLPLKFYLTQP